MLSNTQADRPSPLLEVRGLRKAYGETVALAGVDLDVMPGEIVGLLGPNGAGKTTLVSVVAGLCRPDSGEAAVAGIDVRQQPHRARRLLGLAPQETGVYPTLTGRENLRLFARLAGLSRARVPGAIEEVAASLGLSELLDRRAAQLSGGERRRLHTAMALMHKPPLVLLDEPTVGADVQTRGLLLQLVRSLAADGSGVVYSTHYLGEVEQLGASVVILDHGTVIARGAVAELVDRHALSTVELTFSGAPPPLGLTPGVTKAHVEGNVVRLATHEPATVAALVLHDLGGRAGELLSVRIAQPSLETVFVELTGRRYDAAPGAGDVT